MSPTSLVNESPGVEHEDMSDDLDIRIRSFAELVLEELYAMLRLRSEVFVVEQDCPYNDLDGRDRDARHLLVHRGPDLVGCARLLEDEDGAWIGRIAVDPAARGQGVGAAIVSGRDRRLSRKRDRS